MRFRALAASAAIIAAALFALFAPQSAASGSVKCGTQTAAKFSKWSGRVWDPDRWRRGAPPQETVRAQRRKLSCARGPGHLRAMRGRWRRDKSAFYGKRKHCRSGPVFSGGVSVFGGQTTADGGSASRAGIALRSSATMDRMFLVKTGGHSAYLRQIDWGPAESTGRAIDITFAGAAKLGGVTTDDPGTARLVPSSCM